MPRPRGGGAAGARRNALRAAVLCALCHLASAQLPPRGGDLPPLPLLGHSPPVGACYAVKGGPPIEGCTCNSTCGDHGCGYAADPSGFKNCLNCPIGMTHQTDRPAKVYVNGEWQPVEGTGPCVPPVHCYSEPGHIVPGCTCHRTCASCGYSSSPTGSDACTSCNPPLYYNYITIGPKSHGMCLDSPPGSVVDGLFGLQPTPADEDGASDSDDAAPPSPFGGAAAFFAGAATFLLDGTTPSVLTWCALCMFMVCATLLFLRSGLKVKRMHQKERRLSNLSELSESDALMELPAVAAATGEDVAEVAPPRPRFSYGAVTFAGAPSCGAAAGGGDCVAGGNPFLTPRAGDLGASRDTGADGAPVSFRNPI